MKSARILVVVAVVILLVAAGLWWLQRQSSEKQTSQSALLFREQARDSSSHTPAQQIEKPKASTSLAVETTEEGLFTVQISAWRSSANASREAERFQRAGYDAYVQRAEIPARGGVWYRVRVGQFSTREEAIRQARDLEVQLDSGYWITQKN